MKEDTIQRFTDNQVKSPRAWRDNLIAFRIRRKIINRENELTFKQKEELYNAPMMTPDQMLMLKRVEQSFRKPNEKITLRDGSPRVTKCLKNDTIRVLSGQNERFL